MSVTRGFKIKLTPSPEQVVVMNKWRLAALSLWNLLLRFEMAAYDGSKFRPNLHWRDIWAKVTAEDYAAAVHAWTYGKKTKAGVVKKEPGAGKEPVEPTQEYYDKLAGRCIDGQPPKIFIWQSDLKKIMARLKSNELSQWIAVLPSHAAQQICDDMQDALRHMLRERGRRLNGAGGLNTGFPKFKKYRYAAGSVYMVNTQTVFDHEGRVVALPKLPGVMPFRQEDLPMEGLMGGRLWRQGEDWWLSCQFKVPDPQKLRSIGRECGLKISSGVLATTYDGNIVHQTPPLRPDKKLARRIDLAQRRLARRTKGTKDYYETADEIAQLHGRERGVRNNMLHQVSREIVNKYGSVTVHDLDVASLMTKKRKNKTTGEIEKTPKRLIVMNKNAAMAQFKGMLKYKLTEAGGLLNEVHTYFPEVQKCYVCGKLHAMPLDRRVLTCDCGNVVDRRINASVNEFEQGRVMKLASDLLS
jgi:transposase